jgi:hypothetical protein
MELTGRRLTCRRYHNEVNPLLLSYVLEYIRDVTSSIQGAVILRRETIYAFLKVREISVGNEVRVYIGGLLRGAEEIMFLDKRLPKATDLRVLLYLDRKNLVWVDIRSDHPVIEVNRLCHGGFDIERLAGSQGLTQNRQTRALSRITPTDRQCPERVTTYQVTRKSIRAVAPFNVLRNPLHSFVHFAFRSP